MTIRFLIPFLILVTSAARAGEVVSAAYVVDLARDAARSWADDARLVYLENDRAIDADGRAERWGLLFHSATRDEARAYSLDDDDVERAQPLGFDFDAPPLADEWIDSDEALRRAEEGGGAKFRTESNATLRSMVLVRGVLHVDDPDRTTWTCVYDAPGQPSLWIVIDADDGKILRRWRG